MVKKTTIDLKEVHSEQELHRLLKDEFGFPDFYGMNWHAFWDAITGLVELPEKIVFLNWDTLKNKLPEESKILRKMLEDYNKELYTRQRYFEYK